MLVFYKDSASNKTKHCSYVMAVRVLLIKVVGGI
jgi:hypothetical protein